MTTIYLPLILLVSILSNVLTIGNQSFEIVQQPPEQSGWISDEPNTVTQYADAKLYGVTGLIAHNSGAGQYFFGLQIGDTITVNGSEYVVVEIDYYQALEPSSMFSEFVDLVTGEHYTSSQLFHRYYGKDSGHPVVLQTCIEYNGLNNWGRLFVVADGV